MKAQYVDLKSHGIMVDSRSPALQYFYLHFDRSTHTRVKYYEIIIKLCSVRSLKYHNRTAGYTAAIVHLAMKIVANAKLKLEYQRFLTYIVFVNSHHLVA